MGRPAKRPEALAAASARLLRFSRFASLDWKVSEGDLMMIDPVSQEPLFSEDAYFRAARASISDDGCYVIFDSDWGDTEAQPASYVIDRTVTPSQER